MIRRLVPALTPSLARVSIAASLLAIATAVSCSPPKEAPPEPWTPGVARTSSGAATERGFLDLRGLVHAHSVNSHDACDGTPRDEDGNIDEECFEDFRRDLCTSLHDFVMLSDHREYFDRTEFPDTLLFRSDRGDELVERDGIPVANRAACGDGRRPLILAGAEAGGRSMMPVGLEGHVPVAPSKRGGVYASEKADDIELMKQTGAVVLVAHTENWSADELATLPLDGFEMYNLHANLMRQLPKAIEMVLAWEAGEDWLPHPDLVIHPVLEEDARYLSTWGSVLSRGVKRVTTLGTDCHRNTLKSELADGERVDSYRRMMMWFSNHLLVRPDSDGTWDDTHLKDALRSGRLYGAFEFLGYPDGFDFHAVVGGNIHEMGEEVSTGAKLVVRAPRVAGLDPAADKPEIIVRLLRAIDGGWDEVARSSGNLEHIVEMPGAYRAEIRMIPNHLRDHLGGRADELLSSDRPWILANAVYVTD